MTRIIEAIFTHGVLEPVEALNLPERQRVRLILEIADTGTGHDRKSARQRLLDRLGRSRLAYGGPLPSRDDLHER